MTLRTAFKMIAYVFSAERPQAAVLQQTIARLREREPTARIAVFDSAEHPLPNRPDCHLYRTRPGGSQDAWSRELSLLATVAQAFPTARWIGRADRPGSLPQLPADCHHLDGWIGEAGYFIRRNFVARLESARPTGAAIAGEGCHRPRARPGRRAGGLENESSQGRRLRDSAKADGRVADAGQGVLRGGHHGDDWRSEDPGPDAPPASRRTAGAGLRSGRGEGDQSTGSSRHRVRADHARACGPTQNASAETWSGTTPTGRRKPSP